MPPSPIERRIIAAAACPIRLERRDAGGGKTKPVAVGYGAVFYDAKDPGTEYQLAPGLRERVMPAAFNRCLSERQDVRGLFNHNADFLLGRCSAKTMRLNVDKRGLRYEIDLPDTMAGRDVATSIDRGDLTGSSFSFRVVQQKFSMGDVAGDDDDDVRELHDVDVYDLGPVTFPAYEATSAGLRAVDALAAEVRSAWLAAKRDVKRTPATRGRPSLAEMDRQLRAVEVGLAQTSIRTQMRERLAQVESADVRDGLRRRLDAVQSQISKPVDNCFPVSPALAAAARAIRARIDAYGF